MPRQTDIIRWPRPAAHRPRAVQHLHRECAILFSRRTSATRGASFLNSRPCKRSHARPSIRSRNGIPHDHGTVFVRSEANRAPMPRPRWFAMILINRTNGGRSPPYPTALKDVPIFDHSSRGPPGCGRLHVSPRTGALDVAGCYTEHPRSDGNCWNTRGGGPPTRLWRSRSAKAIDPRASGGSG